MCQITATADDVTRIGFIGRAQILNDPYKASRTSLKGACPMTKSIAIAAISATALIALQAPAHAQMSAFKSLDAGATTTNQLFHKTGRRSRRIGAGIAALGLLGVAAIASHAQASDDNYSEREYRHQRRCNRWQRWCNTGENRACWKYDNRC
jgi:hypothetical protein